MIVLEIIAFCTLSYVSTHFAYKVLKFILNRCNVEFSNRPEY